MKPVTGVQESTSAQPGASMTLRDLFDGRRPTFGAWCSTPSPFAAEVMARAGFDWVCIDVQHGLIGYDSLLAMLHAVAVCDTPALVRVAWNDPAQIMKALDAGADGVLVPMVNSVEQAVAAVGACRYPPDGYRSWGPIRAALRSPGYTPEVGNHKAVCVIQIESVEAVGRVDDILAVPGVDAAYVGPADLAVSAGLAPSFRVEDREHQRLIEQVLDACLRHQVVPGVHCVDPATVLRWCQRGFRMLTVGSDVSFLRQATSEALTTIEKAGAYKAPASPGT